MAKLDIPRPIQTVRDDPDGGTLARQASDVFDAGGDRLLEGMEGIEKTADALVMYGNTQDDILTALLTISDLVDYDGKRVIPKVQNYLVELAKAKPEDRPAIKQRTAASIKNFIQTVNAAEPVHSKETDDLLNSLNRLSRGLQDNTKRP